jgi:hypothetical protein
MIIDKLLSPAIRKNLSTLTVTTQVIGEVMDFGPKRNLGLLSTPYSSGWDINVRGATSDGAPTLALQLVTDDDEALPTPTVIWTQTGISLASLTKFDLFLPIPSTDLWERYVAFRAVVGVAVYTGGTISIEYTADARNWRAYPAQGNR